MNRDPAKSTAGPTAGFWQERFASGRTPWDGGEVNPALEPLIARGTFPAGALVLGRRQGFIEGPPYHCDVNAMRALFPSSAWKWPKPPYDSRAHRSGFAELQLLLTRVG